MGRSAKSFTRSAQRFQVNAKVLIICEDSKSGKTYLEDAKKSFNVDVLVQVAHAGCTDPRGIVQHALDSEKKYDTVYCVIDRDTHETFDEAQILAATSKKIQLIVSYPCFEFWLFLHFEFSRKSYRPAGGVSPGGQVLRTLKSCPGMANYEKGGGDGLFDSLFPLLPEARKRSIRALREAEDVSELNPSSRLHELFDDFEVLAKPKKI